MRSLQVGKADELNAALAYFIADLRHGQHLALEDTRPAQAGLYVRERSIVVARMTDQFPGAIWDGVQDGAKHVLVERASGEDAEGAIGRAQAGFFQRASEAAGVATEDFHLEMAEP